MQSAIYCITLDRMLKTRSKTIQHTKINSETLMYILNQFVSSSNATGMILKLTNFPQIAKKTTSWWLKSHEFSILLLVLKWKQKLVTKTFAFSFALKMPTIPIVCVFVFWKPCSKWLFKKLFFRSKPAAADSLTLKKTFVQCLKKAFKNLETFYTTLPKSFESCISFVFILKTSNFRKNSKQCLDAITEFNQN